MKFTQTLRGCLGVVTLHFLEDEHESRYFHTHLEVTLSSIL